MAVGAAEGAAAGPGHVNADGVLNADRLPGAASGAVFGAVGGAAAPAVAAAGRKAFETGASFVPVAEKWAAGRGSSRAAADAVAADARTAGRGFDTEVDRLKTLPGTEDKFASLSTAGGKEVRELAEVTADRGGRAGEVFDGYRTDVNKNLVVQVAPTIWLTMPCPLSSTPA